MISYTFFLKSGRVAECDRYDRNAKTYWAYDGETDGREFSVLEFAASDVECIATSHAQLEYGDEDVPF